MKANMGSTDKTLRTIIAFILLLSISSGMIGGTLAIIGIIVATIFIATSVFSICPLYSLFGISTRKKTA